MDSYLQDLEQSERQNQLLSQSRRAKQSGTSMLNKLIVQIVNECNKYDPQYIFRYPVDQKTAPGYYTAIQRPICLENMRQKASRQEYQSIGGFKDDMALLRANAETYNGATHGIAAAARH